MNKETAIKNVELSAGSLFTKEDVINLISDIDTEGLEFSVEELIDYVISEFQNLDQTDLVDRDSAEFGLDGDCISLVDVSLDSSEIEDTITTAITDFIRDNK